MAVPGPTRVNNSFSSLDSTDVLLGMAAGMNILFRQSLYLPQRLKGCADDIHAIAPRVPRQQGADPGSADPDFPRPLVFKYFLLVQRPAPWRGNHRSR
jgi:hypothetical protein